jgi:hypothetical protein
MRRKITLRIHEDFLAAVTARALRTHRGMSNAVEALLAQALRLESPRPDHPDPYDARYKARPRRNLKGD